MHIFHWHRTVLDRSNWTMTFFPFFFFSIISNNNLDQEAISILHHAINYILWCNLTAHTVPCRLFVSPASSSHKFILFATFLYTTHEQQHTTSYQQQQLAAILLVLIAFWTGSICLADHIHYIHLGMLVIRDVRWLDQT